MAMAPGSVSAADEPRSAGSYVIDIDGLNGVSSQKLSQFSDACNVRDMDPCYFSGSCGEVMSSAISAFMEAQGATTTKSQVLKKPFFETLWSAYSEWLGKSVSKQQGTSIEIENKCSKNGAANVKVHTIPKHLITEVATWKGRTEALPVAKPEVPKRSNNVPSGKKPPRAPKPPRYPTNTAHHKISGDSRQNVKLRKKSDKMSSRKRNKGNSVMSTILSLLLTILLGALVIMQDTPSWSSSDPAPHMLVEESRMISHVLVEGGAASGDIKLDTAWKQIAISEEAGSMMNKERLEGKSETLA